MHTDDPQSVLANRLSHDIKTKPSKSYYPKLGRRICNELNFSPGELEDRRKTSTGTIISDQAYRITFSEVDDWLLYRSQERHENQIRSSILIPSFTEDLKVDLQIANFADTVSMCVLKSRGAITKCTCNLLIVKQTMLTYTEPLIEPTGRQET